MKQLSPPLLPPAAPRPRPVPHWTDALLGLFVAVLSSSGLVTAFVGGAAVFRVLAVLCGAAIAFRRAFPLASVLVIGVVLVVHVLFIEDLTLVALVGVLVAVWTTQSRLVPPWRWALLVFFCSGAVVVISVHAVRVYEPTDLRGFAVLGMSTTLVLAVAALGGARSRSIRDRRHLAAERLAMLEEQQHTLARLAVAHERNRLAGDLHDLLGHTLTAISAQAEGARCVLAADPARADEALATIARISREGVDQVHDMVALLRGDGDAVPSSGTVPGAAGTTAPGGGRAAPSSAVGAGGGLWERVSALVVACAAPVRLDLDVSAPPAMAPEQEDAMVRNCREALTNAMRHRAPGPISVAGRSMGPQVSLTVENPITGVPSARTGGLGVVSMTSRAHGVGLRCGVGPRGSVWRVEMEAGA